MKEEASEVKSEDKKAFPDKGKKQRFKTPDQVVALEKFYSEHKYPSEELKTQFAVSLGLTEKQISGWFCHRRLKDKRLLSGEASGNGKQDRSSGIILPDHGSGHKQDSCGSTKEGITRHFDQREVESRGFNGQDLLFADLEYEHGRHHDGKINDLDDTSSGSSLPLQNRLHFQNEDPSNLDAFSYLPETENVARRTNLMGIRTRPGPAGYLKMKGRAENPAIASVKRQMGRDYREDGPPLAVEFDHLPPGAFESSMNDPVAEPHYLGIPDVHQSPDSPRILNNPEIITSCDVYNAGMSSGDPHSFKSCDVYNAGMSSGDPHSDGSNFRVKPPSHGHGNIEGLQSMQRPVFSNRYTPFSKRNLATEFNEDFSYEMSVYERKPYAQHDFHGRRKDNFINGRQRGSCPYNSENVSLEQVQRQHSECKYSPVPVKLSKPFNMENRRLPKRMSKDEMVKEKTAMNESSDSARLQGGKRVWEEFREQACRRKALKAESPVWTNQTKRSAAADVPSSFSEDETVVTSSSTD